MTRRYPAVLIACAAVAGLTAGAPALRQGGGTTPADVRRILSALADDSMEGRASGTPGAQRAARYIGGEMRKIGLEPLGDSGYFQRVPLTMDTVRITTRRMRDPNDSNRIVTVPVDPPRIVVRPKVWKSFSDLDSIPAARRKPAVNVVGVIRGSDPALKAEYVLVDAHYDHLGIGRPVNGDSIYNGADDDASGVTAVLEIARQMMKGPKPKRTVVFAAMMGEEVGLLGTNWYIAHPAIPLDRMAANLEIEMIGRPDSLAGGVGRAWLTGYARSNMGEQLAAAGIPIVADKRLEQGFFERSDNIAFARRGIPAHTLSSFNLHSDYHQPSDDISHVDFVHMAGVVNAGAKAVRILSDGPKPEWKPGGKP